MSSLIILLDVAMESKISLPCVHCTGDCQNKTVQPSFSRAVKVFGIHYLSFCGHKQFHEILNPFSEVLASQSMGVCGSVTFSQILKSDARGQAIGLISPVEPIKSLVFKTCSAVSKFKTGDSENLLTLNHNNYLQCFLRILSEVG